MEAIETVGAWAWSDVEEKWSRFEALRYDTLYLVGESAKAFAEVGKALIAQRLHCETQAEFESMLVECTGLTPLDAKRAIAVHEKLSTRQIDTSDHASVRQLLLDVGLMPQPAPGLPSPAQDSPWWIRTTAKLDSKIPKMTPDEKAGLRQWCEATLTRLRG